MPKIIPNQAFKHGLKTYSPEVEYEVSKEDAEYFERNGWVGEKLVNPAAVDLDVHASFLGHASEVK